MGAVTIKRVSGFYRDLLRAYTIEINDTKVGTISRGESHEFDLPPGQHEVRLIIDWCSSPAMTVDGDRNTRLVCKPGSHALLGRFDLFFRQGKYISLERG
ncbi:MAG: hypothetical protein AAFY19_10315 [Pseudomonadota bacterium]